MAVATTADSVLDLCVRKREKDDYDDNDNEVEVDVKYDINNVHSDESKDECDVKPPLLLRQQLHQPMLTHPDPSHSAIMAHLQERIYNDERLHSPPYLSVSPSSNGSAPDTSRISPTFSPLSRTMANSGTMRDPHRSPTYFSDLPPSNGCSITYPPYPVHLSPPYPPLPRVIANGTKGKPTRPFKAYTKDTFFGSNDKVYEEFKAVILAQSKDVNSNKNGNKNMKRPVQSISPHQVPSSSGDIKDQAYWEKRRKNNEAAKRSRDARRAKEDELAIRVAFLQSENIALKAQIQALNTQIENLSRSPDRLSRSSNLNNHQIYAG